MPDISVLAALVSAVIAMHPVSSKIGSNELYCQSRAVYDEMRDLSDQAQIAVAYVLQNRAEYRDTTRCRELKRPYQWAAILNPQKKAGINYKPKWRAAVNNAVKAHYKLVPDPSRGATHFCTRAEYTDKNFIRANRWCGGKALAVIDGVRFLAPDHDPSELLPYRSAPPQRSPRDIGQLIANLEQMTAAPPGRKPIPKNKPVQLAER